jgi:hypothetical protein
VVQAFGFEGDGSRSGTSDAGRRVCALGGLGDISEAEAQVEIQEPEPIQEPGPQQQAAQLMKTGGPADGAVPVMPSGGCPKEFPVKRDGACHR